MTNTSDNGNTGPAFHTLLGDLLENILKHADSPGDCAVQVTAQIRELIGVRLVALVSVEEQGAGPTLQSICPPRLEAEWDRPEIQRFVAVAAEWTVPRFVDPATDPAGRELSAAGIGPSFVIPLSVGADRVGQLVLLGLMDTKGAAAILEALTRVASVIALIIRNSFLYKNLERTVELRTGELALQARIAAIFATVSDDEMFDEVLKVVLDVMHSPFGIFGFIDAAGALVVPTMTRQVWDQCQIPEKSSVFPHGTWGDSLWPRAIREKRAIVANEPSTTIPRGHVGITRHLPAPIILRGKVIGLLHVANKETDYTTADLRTLEAIAGHLAPLLGARLQRNQAVELLRESEEIFNHFMEHSPIYVFFKDEKMRSLRLSRNFETMLGKPLEELLGKSMDELFPSELARSMVADDIRTMEGGKVVAVEEELNGRFYSTTKFPIVIDGKPHFLAGYTIDVTERKIATDKLLKERDFSQTALDSLPGIVYLFDAEGRFLRWNRKFEQVSEYTAEEIGRMSPLDLFVETDRTAVSRKIGETFEKGSAEIEAEFTAKSGKHEPYFFTGRLIDLEGKPCLIGMGVDVTERKRLAEEKSRLADQLRQAQKVEAIGRLAGGIAHDFNNMTAIVLGYGELLLGRLGPEDSARTWAEQIIEAGRRSATLTRQLLAFSRRQVLLPIVLDLNSLLRNLESMLGRLIGENIVLRFDLAGDLGRVTVDPGQIEQVVINLAINARDAMPQGGNLVIETANVELDETYTKAHAETVPGDYVMLALTDTGCGMDKVHLARLFEPFFTTKEMGKGTGLGLATSYGIVKQSGGYIWAYSEPGRGTTFKIYLPRTDAQPAAPAGDAMGEAPRGRGERILLVEDEASLREMWTIILSRLGYRVSTAGSGPAALALIAETGPRPDLVITDVIMPCMSGAEMVQRFRKNWPDLKALFMSGYPDEAITSHGVLGPGISFIQKPFSERALARKVREVLGINAAIAPLGRRVLMIDDDEQYRKLVWHFCAKGGHTFAGVDSAGAAIAALGTQPFDVLLVDLNIPGTSGEQVLREIRAAGHVAPAIVLTGDVASADMAALRPLGAVLALEKSSSARPLLQAIEAATA